MLMLSRHSGESILIYPDYEQVSPTTTIGELFGEEGCITISIAEIKGDIARIGIDSIKEFSIVREELESEFYPEQ